MTVVSAVNLGQTKLSPLTKQDSKTALASNTAADTITANEVAGSLTPTKTKTKPSDLNSATSLNSTTDEPPSTDSQSLAPTPTTDADLDAATKSSLNISQENFEKFVQEENENKLAKSINQINEEVIKLMVDKPNVDKPNLSNHEQEVLKDFQTWLESSWVKSEEPGTKLEAKDVKLVQDRVEKWSQYLQTKRATPIVCELLGEKTVENFKTATQSIAQGAKKNDPKSEKSGDTKVEQGANPIAKKFIYNLKSRIASKTNEAEGSSPMNSDSVSQTAVDDQSKGGLSLPPEPPSSEDLKTDASDELDTVDEPPSVDTDDGNQELGDSIDKKLTENTESAETTGTKEADSLPSKSEQIQQELHTKLKQDIKEKQSEVETLKEKLTDLAKVFEKKAELDPETVVTIEEKFEGVKTKLSLTEEEGTIEQLSNTLHDKWNSLSSSDPEATGANAEYNTQRKNLDELNELCQQISDFGKDVDVELYGEAYEIQKELKILQEMDTGLKAEEAKKTVPNLEMMVEDLDIDLTESKNLEVVLQEKSKIQDSKKKLESKFKKEKALQRQTVDVLQGYGLDLNIEQNKDLTEGDSSADDLKDAFKELADNNQKIKNAVTENLQEQIADFESKKARLKTHGSDFEAQFEAQMDTQIDELKKFKKGLDTSNEKFVAEFKELKTANDELMQQINLHETKQDLELALNELKGLNSDSKLGFPEILSDEKSLSATEKLGKLQGLLGAVNDTIITQLDEQIAKQKQDVQTKYDQFAEQEPWIKTDEELAAVIQEVETKLDQQPQSKEDKKQHLKDLGEVSQGIDSWYQIKETMVKKLRDELNQLLRELPDDEIIRKMMQTKKVDDQIGTRNEKGEIRWDHAKEQMLKIQKMLADDQVSFEKMDQAEKDSKYWKARYDAQRVIAKAMLDKNSKEVFYAQQVIKRVKQHSGQVSANQQIQQSETRRTWVV